MLHHLIRDYSTGERIGQNYLGMFPALHWFLSTISLTKLINWQNTRFKDISCDHRCYPGSPILSDVFLF